MTKRKLLLVALSLCMVAILAMGGTLAYLTDTEDATNTFTVGNVDITLTEEAWTEEGGGEDQGEDAYPGEPLPKDPTVTNVGSNPCFVRVSVTGLDQFVKKYGEGAMIDYRTNYVVGGLGADWVEHTDGYFYYTKVLPVGEATSALFDSIVVPVELTNEEHADENGTAYKYDVKVFAEAVQAQGALNLPWSQVSDPAVMTVDKIAQWFTTCMPAKTPAEG